MPRSPCPQKPQGAGAEHSWCKTRCGQGECCVVSTTMPSLSLPPARARSLSLSLYSLSLSLSCDPLLSSPSVHLSRPSPLLARALCRATNLVFSMAISRSFSVSDSSTSPSIAFSSSACGKANRHQSCTGHSPCSSKVANTAIIRSRAQLCVFQSRLRCATVSPQTLHNSAKQKSI